MIEVLGDPTSNEFNAAEDLRGLIVDLWPAVEKDDKYWVTLISGIKCHKRRTKDIDILVMGSFSQPLTYQQYMPFEADRGKFDGIHTINVESFCFVLEVKNHPFDAVRFRGLAGAETVEVYYQKTGWHDVTEQNHAQIFSARSVFEDNQLTAPWISGLIWLRGVDGKEIPNQTNVLGGNSTWGLFLNKLAVGKKPSLSRQGVWSMSAGNPVDMEAAIGEFTKVMEPTNMDRKKLEVITGEAISPEIEQIREAMKDKELILLRGRPGAGKTIALLRLGYRLAAAEDARVLLLTYNQALAADIRRMISISSSLFG